MDDKPEDNSNTGIDNPDPLGTGLHIGFVTPEEFENRAQLEIHERTDRTDHAHVDLMKEEYTPDEVSRLLGTSLEVVMQAIWHRELKAERKGHNVVCITHADVVDWLRRRGPGV